MPKVQSGTKWRGLAIGVYGNAWPMIATGTPFIVAQRVRLEHRVLEVGGAHVLREELDRPELVLDGLAARARRRR